MQASARPFGTDNIIALDRAIECVLTVKEGKVISANIRTEIVYTAQRSDDSDLQLTFYHDRSSVTKASAPDHKPIYRAWEPGYLLYTGSRVGAQPFSVKAGKDTRVVVEQDFKDAEPITPLILNGGRYDARHISICVRIPAEVAPDVTVHRLRLLILTRKYTLTATISVGQDRGATSSLPCAFPSHRGAGLSKGRLRRLWR